MDKNTNTLCNAIFQATEINVPTCFIISENQLENNDKMGTAMDIHYYVADNIVHVDEAEKVRRFENFFMKQIQNNDDVLRQLEAIKIEL